MKKQRFFKRTVWCMIAVFICMNMIAFLHAYKFTHFADSQLEKTQDARLLSTAGKLKALIFGVDNPRPAPEATPTQVYETIKLQSNKEIECWSIEPNHAKGTILLFHGYSGEKSLMLDKSDELLKLGYNTLLVDFMGSGGSEGNQTTIGYLEAEEVKTCYEYLNSQGEGNIFLFGTSMGAVAILKAMRDYHLTPKGIILECPFGSLYQTTCARFRTMGIPSFPMAGLLVFWGGVQNGFWAFAHQPEHYAKSVTCPTLLLYGEQDEKVSRQEIDNIYRNLKGEKILKTYPFAGHENYLIAYGDAWRDDMKAFLSGIAE